MSFNNLHTNYKPQLDGLRAIAVGIVIASHWIPTWKVFSSGAHIGVQLFFILSGYLITGILLNASDKAEFKNSGMGLIIMSFYARRFIRIFPLYYLILLIMFIIGAPNIIEHFSWHLTYTTNFKIALSKSWLGEASHLWTLAVEEQFYLVWPFVILFTPRRFLLHTIIAFILISPIFKMIYGAFGGGLKISVIPISSFHSLGTGALLSLFEIRNKSITQKTVTKLSLIGLLAFIILNFTDKSNYMLEVAEDISLTLFMVGLIYRASKGFNGIAGNILSSSPFLYIGKISYGIYLMHNFIPFINTQLFNYLGYNPIELLSPYGYLGLNTTILLLLSSLFWYYFERKINIYKKFFPYVREKKLVLAV